ncbi:hypothetical protein [Geothrix sp. 21YS21S-2]|uniref:hypothetical protein n=1 Tax=Geothrix sp. 21YS21S-2 TaxID=3068893 RepID=UPI0027BAFD8E|nr:hypothetical protein [Geothrix sp. 21YS21S-2]
MARRKRKKDPLDLTPMEAESLGIGIRAAERPQLPLEVRERPLHEQVAGALTEDDVVESMLDEVTLEGHEDVEEAVADQQEDAAEEDAAN